MPGPVEASAEASSCQGRACCGTTAGAALPDNRAGPSSGAPTEAGTDVGTRGSGAGTARNGAAEVWGAAGAEDRTGADPDRRLAAGTGGGGGPGPGGGGGRGGPDGGRPGPPIGSWHRREGQPGPRDLARPVGRVRTSAALGPLAVRRGQVIAQLRRGAPTPVGTVRPATSGHGGAPP